MPSALALRAKRDLDDLVRFMDAGDALSEARAKGGRALEGLEPSHCALVLVDYAPLASSSERRLTHSLVYSRAYADLEGFIYEALGEYLDYLSRTRSFDKLEEATKTAFRLGTAAALKDINRDRYSALTEADLVKNHSDALKRRKYRLFPQVMLGFERNYDLDEICRLYRNCGIAGVENWLNSHSELSAYFENRAADTPKSMLKELVLSRNEVSHGPISNVASQRVLRDTIEFVGILIGALDDLLTHAYARDYVVRSNQRVCCISERITPTIGILIGNGMQIMRGQRLLLKRGARWQIAHAAALQFDGVAVRACLLSRHVELGVQFDVECRSRSSVFAFPKKHRDLCTQILEARLG